MCESDDNATRTRNIFVRNYSSGVVKIFEQPQTTCESGAQRKRERERESKQAKAKNLRELGLKERDHVLSSDNVWVTH